VLAALRQLLRPLVRLLISHQIQFPALSGLLKETYVEVAERSFALAGKTQTDSRVNLLTGVHRKDVRRLRIAPPAPDQAPPKSVTLGALLVSVWTSDPRYSKRGGRALPLPRVSSGHAGPSFEELVESVSKDIRPRSILDEWLRLGIAHVDDQDRVVLNANAFVPERGLDEKAFYFGRNLRDHVDAAARNLEGGKKPLFERSVYYSGLSPESASELETLAGKLGMGVLQAVNRRASQLKARDAKKKLDASERITLGVYFLRAPTPEDDDET
jgi:uncharacterized protein DUF6502